MSGVTTSYHLRPQLTNALHNQLSSLDFRVLKANSNIRYLASPAMQPEEPDRFPQVNSPDCCLAEKNIE